MAHSFIDRVAAICIFHILCNSTEPQGANISSNLRLVQLESNCLNIRGFKKKKTKADYKCQKPNVELN